MRGYGVRKPSTARFILPLLLALAVSAAAQTPPARPPAPATATPAPAVTIDAASWLAGRWVGEGLGGQLEEVWSPAHGGQMVGHFALIVNGAPRFYELLLIDVQPGGLRMRVKHFNPDFTAWEDRAGWHSFEPVSVTADTLSFNGLTLRRDDDRLLITITLRDRGGPARDHLLTLRRAPL